MELPPPVPCSGGLWDARSWPSPPSPSFVCAGWQKSSGLLAGSGPSLLPNSFSVESLQAGMGGTGAPSEAGLSHPLAFSVGFLLSQNNSVGKVHSLAGGQQTRSWPTASSATPSLPGQLIPEGPSLSDTGAFSSPMALRTSLGIGLKQR